MKTSIILFLALVTSLTAKTGLIVTTITGDEPSAGTNMQVFIQINGEGKKHPLDSKEDDRDIAATNVYPRIDVS